MKTYQEINEKIKNGTAVVLTAEEVSALSKSLSPKAVSYTHLTLPTKLEV